MASKGRKLIVILLTAVVLVAFLAVSSGAPNVGEAFKSKPQVECNAVVDADIFSSPDLESASCIKTGKTCSSLFSIQPFDIFNTEGVIVFSTSDDQERETFSIGKLSEERFTVRLCTDSDEVEVKIVDKDGVNVDSLQVTIQ